ncbi:cytochrome P450 [Pyrenochaeta sp. DS3sAY3a]|nr:cytochrome P450 [Pyrenochaeta sp. DS3sAY3a]
MLSTGVALQAFLLLPIALVIYIISKIIYNLYFHPLRSFPGPLLARATVLTYQRELWKGYPHKWLQELHEDYGPVVRCAPNELSFIEPETWKDVYGHKATALVKDTEFYGPDASGEPPGLIRADNISHARQRRLVSHAFSDRALKDQEPLLKGYVELLIEKLTEAAAQGQVNMVAWYNFTTFDIMADLTFGESLGQLASSSYNPWVNSIFSHVKVGSLGRLFRSWPGLTGLVNVLIPSDIREKGEAHTSFSHERVDKRMARKTERPDIWDFVSKHTETEGYVLAPTELHSNGALFMLAGTETTATELSGLTYLLLKHPVYLERLTHEIRGSFSSMNDMTMTKLSHLEFLNACLQEGLRMYPPVAVGLPRRVPKEGATVCGHWVAGGTTVQCPHYAISHSATNWLHPNSFSPERFLPEGAHRFVSDRRAALNPFSFGPRNCLGKNLAYHEMRLILASVLFHFDLELCDDREDWLNQEVFTIWVKKPLLVKLRPIR